MEIKEYLSALRAGLYARGVAKEPAERVVARENALLAGASDKEKKCLLTEGRLAIIVASTAAREARMYQAADFRKTRAEQNSEEEYEASEISPTPKLPTEGTSAPDTGDTTVVRSNGQTSFENRYDAKQYTSLDKKSSGSQEETTKRLPRLVSERRTTEKEEPKKSAASAIPSLPSDTGTIVISRSFASSSGDSFEADEEKTLPVSPRIAELLQERDLTVRISEHSAAGSSATLSSGQTQTRTASKTLEKSVLSGAQKTLSERAVPRDAGEEGVTSLHILLHNDLFQKSTQPSGGSAEDQKEEARNSGFDHRESDEAKEQRGIGAGKRQSLADAERKREGNAGPNDGEKKAESFGRVNKIKADKADAAVKKRRSPERADTDSGPHRHPAFLSLWLAVLFLPTFFFAALLFFSIWIVVNLTFLFLFLAAAILYFAVLLLPLLASLYSLFFLLFYATEGRLADALTEAGMTAVFGSLSLLFGYFLYRVFSCFFLFLRRETGRFNKKFFRLIRNLFRYARKGVDIL